MPAASIQGDEPVNPVIAASPDTTKRTLSSVCLKALLPALQRLDQLLEAAAATVQSYDRQGSRSFPGLYIDEAEIARLLAQPPASSPFDSKVAGVGEPDAGAFEGPLVELIRNLHLSAFDVDVIILALAPELDLRYERLYGFIQDDITRKHATVDLALNLLCSTAEAKLEGRAHFEPQSPLLRNGVLQLVPDPSQIAPPLLAHYLKLNPQITRYLLGQCGLDPQLAAYCEIVDGPGESHAVAGHEELTSIAALLAAPTTERGKAPRIYFQGAPGAGKRRAAEELVAITGRSLVACDLSCIVDAQDFDHRLSCVVREGMLRGAVLYLCGMDALRSEAHTHKRESVIRKLAGHPGPVILAGSHPWTANTTELSVYTLRFGSPGFEKRRACWQSQTDVLGVKLTSAQVDALAGRFRLTEAQIEAVANSAWCTARWRAAESSQATETAVPTLDDLYASARAECGHELAALAKRIETRHGWDDIVLPPDQLAQLREICNQAAYRHVVYDSWGFDRKLTLGKGLNVLFFGAPGTGKTMAAEVIAGELRLDLYRIDLSQVISKYIGETEKNLDRIFGAAENSNAILFFDEADALFGKRSEVRDAHDRYANLEVSYLLQKMEEYQGISILATNLRQNLDDAFVRRLQTIVEFPFPDEEYRQRIWQRAFPREAPMGDDVQFDRLAREVRLAGGNIKNMALAAAFLAAPDGQVIHMEHLVQAARREHQKLGRAWNDAPFHTRAVKAGDQPDKLVTQ